MVIQSTVKEISLKRLIWAKKSVKEIKKFFHLLITADFYKNAENTLEYNDKILKSRGVEKLYGDYHIKILASLTCIMNPIPSLNISVDIYCK
jgi:hypothetical protein